MFSLRTLAARTSLIRLTSGNTNNTRPFIIRFASSNKKRTKIATSSHLGDENDEKVVTFGLVSDEQRVRHGVERSTLHDDLDLEKDGLEAYEAKLADTSRPRPVDYLRQINKLVREKKLQVGTRL